MKPHEFIGEKAEYDDYGQYLFRVDKEGKRHILLQIRGWASIEKLFPSTEEAESFQDNLGEWIAEAINEKIAREKLEEIENSDTAKKLIVLSKQIDKDWFSKHREVSSDRYRSKCGWDKRSIAMVIKGTIKYYAPKDDLF